MRALLLLALPLALACNAAPPPETATAPAPSAAPSPAPTPAPAPSPAPAASAAAPATTAVASASATAAADAPDPLIGQPAPDFTTTTHDGKPLHLAALKGKSVVLYFYPKDETPGCTKEACSFRDAWAPLAKTGAVLVGISADDAASHKKFIAHWKLPFLLASDPDDSIGKLYGVPLVTHENMTFHQRQTIVIGADGNVKKVYRKVDVGVHAQQILADLGGAT